MTRRLISAIHVSFVLFLSTTSSLAVSSSTTSEASSEELLQQMHAHPSQSHTETQTQTSSSSQYGVDCSWPIHSLEFNNKTQRCSYKYPDLLGDRTSLYSNFIQGCRNQYGERCDETEFSRIEQARMQPQSMVNYTSTGYHKMRAPKRLFQLIIQEHWERNKHRATAEEEEEEQEFVEKWAKGHTYVNYWEINTTYYGLSDAKAGGSHALCDEILYEAQQVLEEWTSMELRPTSLYGIRVYKEGSILVPHVDRMPLVSSAIINVAQDPDMQEDWPLEVYDRNGQAVNISMVPGDMVLYESGSLVHGVSAFVGLE